MSMRSCLMVLVALTGCQQEIADTASQSDASSQQAPDVPSLQETATAAADDATTSEAEVTAVAFNAAGDPTLEFSVPAMMCPHGCAPKVKELLAEQQGVKDVKVTYETKTAVVAVDEAEFDSAQAIAVLADHGFEDSSLQLSDTSAAPAADAGQSDADQSNPS